MTQQYVRISGEKSLPAESLQLFDSLITDAQAHLKALSDLEHPVEKKMAIGVGIHYSVPNSLSSVDGTVSRIR